MIRLDAIEGFVRAAPAHTEERGVGVTAKTNHSGLSEEIREAL